MNGFALRTESEHDCYGAGHAGTALSAALGMAAARDQRGSDEHVVTIFGQYAPVGGNRSPYPYLACAAIVSRRSLCQMSV